MSAASLSLCPDSGRNLPDDLITKILVRLPVGYLVRFELVCKAWLYNIRSPGFMKMHMNITADRESPKSFIVCARKFGLRDENVFCRVNWPDEDLVLPCKFTSKNFHSVVIGVANDICLDGMLYWSNGKNVATYDLNTEEFNNQIELPKVEAIGGEIVEYMDSFADIDCSSLMNFDF